MRLGIPQGLRNLHRDEFTYQRFAVVLLGALLVVGFWLRIRNVGALSLLGDEGIEALAVKGVLEHGIPKVDSGLVYNRWPLYLYMQSAFAWIFRPSEFWLRVPSVIWGTATIIPAYILGKDLFNRTVGLLVALVLSFSVWEVELSRYARGYTIFQFFFTTSLILFYRGFFKNSRKHRVYFTIIATVTLFTHQLSEVIITIFLVPLLYPDFSRRKKLIFIAWGALVAGIIVARKKFVGFSLPPHLSELQAGSQGIAAKISSYIGVPTIEVPSFNYFFDLTASIPELTAILLLISGASLGQIIYTGWGKSDYLKYLISFLVVIFSFLHLFGISLILVAAYLSLYPGDILKNYVSTFAISVWSSILLLVSWVFAFKTSVPSLNMVSVIKKTFGYPDIYSYMIEWLVKGHTALFVVFLIGCVLLLLKYIRKEGSKVPLFIVGSLFVPAVAASFFDAFNVSRYFFHLYPLVIIIYTWVVYRLVSYILKYSLGTVPSGQLVSTFICIPLILLASGDAVPTRAWDIGNRTYQSEIDYYRGPVSWEFYAGFHQDLKGPSKFVRARAEPQDAVVVLEPEHMVCIYKYYIGEIDYYFASTNNIHRDVLYRKGKNHSYIHYITGTHTITDTSSLERVIDNTVRSTWIIMDKRFMSKENPIYNDKISNYLEGMSKEGRKEYVSRDGKFWVIKR